MAQRDVIDAAGGWEAFVALEHTERWQRLFEREAHYNELTSREGITGLHFTPTSNR